MLQPYHLRVCTDADWPQALALIRNVFVGEGFGSAVRADRWCRREIMEPGGQTLIAVEGGVPRLIARHQTAWDNHIVSLGTA